MVTSKSSIDFLLMSFIIASSLFVCGNSDAAKDKEECTQQVIGLSTCLTYVEGKSKSPTPDCCSGLKQVLKSDKKCLCVVIQDRNDPDLGLSINVTLALGLPSVCNAPANVSQCPELLHLKPNSPDAKVFYQTAHNSGNATSSPPSSSTTTGKGNHTDVQTGPGAIAQQKSSGYQIGKRWFGLKLIVVTFIWCLTSMLNM